MLCGHGAGSWGRSKRRTLGAHSNRNVLSQLRRLESEIKGSGGLHSLGGSGRGGGGGGGSSCLLRLLRAPGVLDLWLHHFNLCLCLHMAFLHMSVCVPSAYKDTLIQCDLILTTSAQTLFPNKVTLSGSGKT